MKRPDISKGEWISCDNLVFEDKSRMVIADCRYEGFEPSQEEIISNANLISAAPNMLDALIQIYSSLVEFGEPLEKDLRMIIDAMKKAGVKL